MKLNKIIITTGGILLIILGVFHMCFWYLYDWSDELPKLSQDNNSIVQMMAICTICFLLLMGFILIICRAEITRSRSGRLLLLSLSIFFAVRLILEFIFPNGSLALSGILLLLVLIYLVPALSYTNNAKRQQA